MSRQHLHPLNTTLLLSKVSELNTPIPITNSLRICRRLSLDAREQGDSGKEKLVKGWILESTAASIYISF